MRPSVTSQSTFWDYIWTKSHKNTFNVRATLNAAASACVQLCYESSLVPARWEQGEREEGGGGPSGGALEVPRGPLEVPWGPMILSSPQSPIESLWLRYDVIWHIWQRYDVIWQRYDVICQRYDTTWHMTLDWCLELSEGMAADLSFYAILTLGYAQTVDFSSRLFSNMNRYIYRDLTC